MDEAKRIKVEAEMEALLKDLPLPNFAAAHNTDTTIAAAINKKEHKLDSKMEASLKVKAEEEKSEEEDDSRLISSDRDRDGATERDEAINFPKFHSHIPRCPKCSK